MGIMELIKEVMKAETEKVPVVEYPYDSVMEENMADGSPSMEARYERKEVVRQALGKLSELDRKIVKGILMDGYNQADLASRLGISQSTLNSRLQIAVSKLRDDKDLQELAGIK